MADQRELWKDGLERLRQTAAGKSYHVTVGDIVKCFQGIELDRQKVARIYQYADEKNIIIDDYEPHDTYSITVTNIDEDDDDDEGAAEDMADPRPQIRVERTAIKTGRGAASGTVSKDGRAEDGLGKEEKAYLDDYLRALRDIEEEADGETGWLLERLISGDDSVASRLTEINLRTVVDMAKRVAGKGVAIGDLIQEGNLALVSAIDDYRTTGLTAIDEEFRVMLYTKIEQAMDAAIGEETHFTETAEKLARDANRLLTLTRELEEQLGRSASLTELAEKMGEAEEYIKEVMRVSQAVMDNEAARRG
jgi:DNA-directed RNA polymerase sigma subunit (sigma70/sigma32)